MKNLAELHTLLADSNVHEVDLAGTSINDGSAPYIIVRHGEYVAVLCLMGLADHLCIDVHSFVAGERATSAAFGMTAGCRSQLTELGSTSHGWNSASLVSVLLGRQATTEEAGR